MAIYSQFCINSIAASEARTLAQTWKAAKPATRKAAVKQMGDGFKVEVIGSFATFSFYANGTVRTENRKRNPNRWQEPSWAKTQTKYAIDESRAVIGFAYGRPIYA